MSVIQDIIQRRKKAKKIHLANGQIDPRYKLLSHSSSSVLHACPRKFQLDKLTEQEDTDDISTNVSFAFGTTVGVGIQSALEGKSKNQIYLDTFLAWDCDLLEENSRQGKSFWAALFAVEQFIFLYEENYLADYKLALYKNVPTTEFSFRVDFSDGFAYRGYIDAILQNKVTGDVAIFECKTTSRAPNIARYENTNQTVGYLSILNTLFPYAKSYTVIYLVYNSSAKEFIKYVFGKTKKEKLNWIRSVYTDCEKIALYNKYTMFPKYGESCFAFNRACKYFGMCNLSTKYTGNQLTQGIVDNTDDEQYTLNINHKQLLNKIESK